MALSTATFETLKTIDDLYQAIRPLSMDAGWLRTPGSTGGSFEAAHWHWTDARAALELAGRLVTPDLTERRNLALMSPGGGNGTLATLVCAYQLVLPNERARSHRHTANALRLILDTAADVYTIVDGARLDMFPGDVVLTPSWCWHGHSNDGRQPAYWLDYLDSTLCRALGQYVFEPHPDAYEAVTESPPNSPYVYSWREVEPKLYDAPIDPTQSFARRYLLDRIELTTMGLSMCALDSRYPTSRFINNVNALYSVVRGHGHSVIGNQTFEWQAGDVFAVPARTEQHHVAKDAVLFCVDDAPLLEAVGLLRI